MAASGERTVPSATATSTVVITTNMTPRAAVSTPTTNVSSLPSSHPNVPLSLSSTATARVKPSVRTIGWDDLDLPRFYAAGFLAHLSAVRYVSLSKSFVSSYEWCMWYLMHHSDQSYIRYK
jgi:hypothetical protein